MDTIFTSQLIIKWFSWNEPSFQNYNTLCQPVLTEIIFLKTEICVKEPLDKLSLCGDILIFSEWGIYLLEAKGEPLSC